MKNLKIYLDDIYKSIKSIEIFIEKMTYEQFKEDDKTSSAVVRKFEIIGEAANHIPEEIRLKHPEILWKEMAGMRDKLIHSYSNIDYKLVWMTIKQRFPEVKPMLKKIINSFT